MIDSNRNDSIDATEAAEATDLGTSEPEQRDALVSAQSHGQRLDHVLVALAPEFSRSYLQQLIEQGYVRLDDMVVGRASRRVHIGQRIALTLMPTPESQAFRPESIPLAIVHEDAHLLVLNKPPGLVVHPAAGNWSGTLLNGLLAHHRGAAALPRAGIVHRLDKDTSGLMVVAKTLASHTALVRAIAAREVNRHYLALAHGALKSTRLSIDAPIGRDPASRLRMAVLASGKPARTDVERIAQREGVSALRCTLHTGRTHQIRVHLARQNHPLLADGLYGGAPALGLTRQALHAQQLAFAHPAGGQFMQFEQALPPDLAPAWAWVTGRDSS